MVNLKYSFLTICLVFILAGCSTAGNMQSTRSGAHNLPKIPEIKQQARTRPRYTPTVKRYKPTVKRYSVNKKVAVVISREEEAAAREILRKDAIEEATVDIDPYASIPESNSSSSTVINDSGNATSSKANPAVTSLVVQARADIATGKSQAAISKLERGLRIESQNPSLWYLLAKAHYAQSDYQQAIVMAKKSNRYSGNDDLIAENWRLIKKAGEKSGDASAVKEALDYIKLNP